MLCLFSRVLASKQVKYISNLPAVYSDASGVLQSDVIYEDILSIQRLIKKYGEQVDRASCAVRSG